MSHSSACVSADTFTHVSFAGSFFFGRDGSVRYCTVELDASPPKPPSPSIRARFAAGSEDDAGFVAGSSDVGRGVAGGTRVRDPSTDMSPDSGNAAEPVIPSAVAACYQERSMKH